MAKHARAVPPIEATEPRSGLTANGGGSSQALELDRLIHERMRLALISALAVNDSLSFIELRRMLDTTDGNLSVHARKLEEAGYIQCEKGFEGRVPRTDYRLTAEGRQALERYLAHMEAVINAAKGNGAVG